MRSTRCWPAGRAAPRDRSLRMLHRTRYESQIMSTATTRVVLDRSVPIVVARPVAAATGSRVVRAGGSPPPPDRAGAVTFTETIAPILYDNCVTCHRPGEAAPFSLISYEDAAKRGTLIAKVTQSRYMPPWHAEPGFGDFADERRLTDAQIATIAEWVSRACRAATPRDAEAAGVHGRLAARQAGSRCSRCPRRSTCRRADPTSIATSRFRPASPRTNGFAPWSSARARARRASRALSVRQGGAVAEHRRRDGKPGFGGAMPVRWCRPSRRPAIWAAGRSARRRASCRRTRRGR